MRLIDADSVKRGIEELKQSPWYNEKNLDHFPIRKEAVEVVEHLCIDNEPTVDAEPIRHGHWINHISENGATDGIFCSRCDYEIERHSRPKYCPDCGAKMDEVTE